MKNENVDGETLWNSIKWSCKMEERRLGKKNGGKRSRNGGEMMWKCNGGRWNGGEEDQGTRPYIRPPLRAVYGANLARRLYVPYKACKPGQKALRAVYGLETSLTGHKGRLTGSMRAIKPPSLLSRPPYEHKGGCKAWKWDFWAMRPFATTKIPMHMDKLVRKHFRTHPNIQKWADKKFKRQQSQGSFSKHN